MQSILIFAGDVVAARLVASPVGREGFERVTVKSPAEALAKALALRPRLVVVDSSLQQTESVVRQLRAGPDTRDCSILVVTSGDTWEAELGLLDAGANAVLRMPPGPGWDARIESLLHVPTRKDGRIDGTLDLTGEAGEQAIRAQVFNISATGMLLETKAALLVGADFRFTLELRGFEASAGDVRGTGRVVRQAVAGRYGAEFVDLEPYGRELLRRYLIPR